jgi:hypothetical protein
MVIMILNIFIPFKITSHTPGPSTFTLSYLVTSRAIMSGTKIITTTNVSS